MASVDTLHKHHHQHFDYLQLSSKEFYALLEEMIREYKFPDVSCERTTMKESGIFSSSREYLSIKRKRQLFYVCAAPFGKSFFISWYMIEEANTAANITEKIPLIGKPIAKEMERKTYYQYDTELMFTESIQSIIKLAIEKVSGEHGHRKNEQAT
ncbi:MAG: hypothetical protein JST50_06875 [Bacteroidetes bacterium]|jgi:hypothetical protein|nr:hypothetical protein [Bacteroidota bacterium]